jgi:hypothetical protein
MLLPFQNFAGGLNHGQYIFSVRELSLCQSVMRRRGQRQNADGLGEFVVLLPAGFTRERTGIAREIAR